MTGHRDITTFDKGMQSSRSTSYDLFRRHVNPEAARLFKLGNVDKKYVSASGAILLDEDGREYLDFTAGYGSLNLGHNPREVLEAVARAQTLPSVLLIGYNHLAGALGENLAKMLPGGLSVATFGSGGAEAVENAIKTSMAYTRRKKFVSCRNGYHGLSMGAVSLCGTDRFREALGYIWENCSSVPYGDLSALEQVLRTGDVAGFVVEPIQGEGGAVVPPAGYLKGAEELCRRHGTMLILDEIQTGFGRTGKMFAMEHEGVVPDIVTLSKSLTAGVVPCSVSVTTEEIWTKAFGSSERFDIVMPTYGGHAAACAAALKTMEVILRDDLPGRAMEMGEYARKRLEETTSGSKIVEEIRGRGLLLGIKLSQGHMGGARIDENLSAMIINRLLNKHGILTSYYDLDPTVIRFEPPLITTKQQIDKAIDAIDAVMGRSVASLALSFGMSSMGRMLKS